MKAAIINKTGGPEVIELKDIVRIIEAHNPLSALIIENNYQLSDITNTGNQSDYIFVINRSISYFLWDMFALLFEDEEYLLFLFYLN